MSSLSTWPKPALVALAALLFAAISGWGFAIERSSRVGAREEALAAAEARGRAAQQRAGEVEGALAAERGAAGDLAALQARLGAAQGEAAAAEARANELRTSTGAAERQVAEFRQQAAAEEQRLLELHPAALASTAPGFCVSGPGSTQPRPERREGPCAPMPQERSKP